MCIFHVRRPGPYHHAEVGVSNPHVSVEFADGPMVACWMSFMAMWVLPGSDGDFNVESGASLIAPYDDVMATSG